MKINIQRMLFVGVLLLSTNMLINAQSLSKKLGGIKTDFIITSDTVVLEIFDQMLVQLEAKGGSTDAPYTYEAWHLEFITRDKIQRVRQRGKSKVFYTISLIDQNGATLARINNNVNKVKVISNKNEPVLYTHRINLANVPIILLEKTTRFDIVYYEQKWRTVNGI